MAQGLTVKQLVAHLEKSLAHERRRFPELKPSYADKVLLAKADEMLKSLDITLISAEEVVKMMRGKWSEKASATRKRRAAYNRKILLNKTDKNRQLPLFTLSQLRRAT